MKIHSPSALLFLAALSAALAGPLAATGSSAPAAFYRVRVVERDGVAIATPGDSAGKVTASLGHPEQLLSPENWVYRSFRSQATREQAKEGCTILLVTFIDGRVSEMRRINEAAVQLLATRLAVEHPSHRVVVKN